MNLSTLNYAIQEMCSEVSKSYLAPPNWTTYTEKHLLFEVVVCTFSSQMPFELAVAAAERMRDVGILSESTIYKLQNEQLKKQVEKELKIPLTIEINGVKQKRLPRFNKRLASLFSQTVAAVYREGRSLHSLLSSSNDSLEARSRLVDVIHGFGPKQASLFLRRIGFCTNLAVLDTHILDYLFARTGVRPKQSSLSNLPRYEKVESDFNVIAASFGHPVGEVDLAMWITMRVAKRERVWA